MALRKVPGLPSAGHAALISVFVALNIVAGGVNLQTKNSLLLITNVAFMAAWYVAEE